jgi:hypothetical protein
MSISYERALLLINVIKGAADLGPKDGNSISALAAMELRAIDDTAKQDVVELAAKARAAAEAKAAEEAEARAAQEAADAEEVEGSEVVDDGPKTVPSSKYTQADTARRV